MTTKTTLTTSQQHQACFVAGTLVHTDKGLVPIQDLKVGDMVLSKPEDGSGKLEYKPVLSTFKSPVKEKIYKVEYYNATANGRGEKGVNFLFCTANHPFWVTKQPVTDANKKLKGEWFASEKIPGGGCLTSAHGDELYVDDYSFIPVRTLPNFPKGCAYTQSIEEHDLWETGGSFAFASFTEKGYQLISLAESEEAYEHEKKTLTWQNTDALFELNDNNPMELNPSLYRTLTTRLDQDIGGSKTYSSDVFMEHMNAPLVLDGKVIKENRIGDVERYKNALSNIEKYGDAKGLTGESFHEQMQQYYDPCPNPFEDYVYNIEVADHHTYFVGHDAVWVHNCDPSTIKHHPKNP